MAERLEEAAGALILVVGGIPLDHWGQVARNDVWSIGKNADHVAEATA